MAIFKVPTRVRIDWDGDGYLHSGVPDGTPENLIPSPIYSSPLRIAYEVGELIQRAQIIKETTLYGYEYAEIDDTGVSQINIGLDPTTIQPSDAYPNLYDFVNADWAMDGWLDVDEPSAAKYGGRVLQYTLLADGSLQTIDGKFTQDLQIPVDSTKPIHVHFQVRMRVVGGDAAVSPTVQMRVDYGDALSDFDDITTFDFLSEVRPTPLNIAGDTLTDGEWTDWGLSTSMFEGYNEFIGDDEYIGLGMRIQATTGAVKVEIQIAGMMLFSDAIDEIASLDLDSFSTTGTKDPTHDGSGDFTVFGDLDNAGDYSETMKFDIASGSFSAGSGDIRVLFAKMTAIRGTTSTENGDQYRIQSNLAVGSYSNFPDTLDSFDDTAQTITWADDDSEWVGVELRNSSSTDMERDAGFNYAIYDASYAPTTYWQPSASVEYTDGLIEIDPTKNYVFTFFARMDVAGTIDIQPRWINSATSEVTLDTAIASKSIGTDWTRVDVSLTAIGGSNINYLSLLITNTDQIQLVGWMLVEGTTLYPYHVGSLAHRDDIQQYVKSVSWKSGRNKFEDPLAFEGEMEIVLNNSSGLWSPKNSIFKQNLKMELQVQKDNQWHTLWTGWTRKIEMTVGTNSAREVVLIGNQGITLLREGEFAISPQENVQIDTMIRDMIDASGWKSAYNPFFWQVGFDSRLGENTYLQNVDDSFSRIDEGVNVLELAGMDWGRETELGKALKELLESENARMWLDREGALVFVNRHHELNVANATSMNLGTEVQEAEYVYGQDIVNRVEVIFSEKQEVTRQPVWSGTINIPARNPRNIYLRSTVVREIQFNYEEGRVITPTRVYGLPQDMDISVVNGRSKAEIPDSEWDYQVHVSLNNNGQGRYFLQLRNNLDVPVDVSITVYADYIRGAEAQPIVIQDDDAQDAIKTVYREVLKNKQIGNDESAISLGQWLINRKALPSGS